MKLGSWTLRRRIFWMSNQTLLLFGFSYSLSIGDHFAYGPSIVDYQSVFGAFRWYVRLRADSFARSNSMIEGWSFHHFQLLSWNIGRGTLYRFEGSFIYFSVVAGNIDLFILAGLQLLVIHINVLSRSSVWNSICWAEIAWIFRLLLFGYVAAGGSLHFPCRLFANLDLFVDSDFSRHQSPLSICFHVIGLLQKHILIFEHHVAVLVFFLENDELCIGFRIFIQTLMFKLHLATPRSDHLSVVLLTVALQNSTLGWLWPYLPLLDGLVRLPVA